MIKFLKQIISYGVSEKDDFYSERLKKAINILSLNAMVCILIAVAIGVFVQNRLDSLQLLLAIPLYSLVFYLNKINRAHIGITVMFGLSTLMLIFYSLKTGEAAGVHFMFILNIIGLAVLYRKGKIRWYYYGNLVFSLVSLAFVLLSYENGWFKWLQDQTVVGSYERKVNLFFLISCSILFSIVVVTSFSRQFARLSKTIDEKEVLLAELNHRVKNNLMIIVSLLRLKQDISVHSETKEALRDIGNRIHSMALVHRQMYAGEGKSYIKVPEYIDDLMDGICASLGEHPDISCSKNIEDISLEVSDAIPVGMILNELIMNSMKHAFDGIENPKINIEYSNINDKEYQLTYHDNGVGMTERKRETLDSLGLELIHSLTDQLDGKCVYTNGEGLTFEMKFPIKK